MWDVIRYSKDCKAIVWYVTLIKTYTTCVHMICSMWGSAGSAPAVALLLHARADPDELDGNNETPLHLACRP